MAILIIISLSLIFLLGAVVVSGLKDPVLSIELARCNLLAAIFVMLKILRLLFVARIELFNNNGRLAPVKTKITTEARKA